MAAMGSWIMPAPDPAVRAIASHSRANLVWGVSLAALVTALGAGQGRAQSVGALMAASHQAQAAVAAVTASAVAAPSAMPGTSAGMAAASARALRNQTQVNQALTLAQQAQAAGRAAALAASSDRSERPGRRGAQPGSQPGSGRQGPDGPEHLAGRKPADGVRGQSRQRHRRPDRSFRHSLLADLQCRRRERPSRSSSRRAVSISPTGSCSTAWSDSSIHRRACAIQCSRPRPAKFSGRSRLQARSWCSTPTGFCSAAPRR